jgi:hypothetical protein
MEGVLASPIIHTHDENKMAFWLGFISTRFHRKSNLLCEIRPYTCPKQVRIQYYKPYDRIIRVHIQRGSTWQYGMSIRAEVEAVVFLKRDVSCDGVV